MFLAFVSLAGVVAILLPGDAVGMLDLSLLDNKVLVKAEWTQLGLTTVADPLLSCQAGEDRTAIGSVIGVIIIE